MSKTFFDHLLDLSELEGEIKKIEASTEEKEELWAIIDEILHHKVLGCIFDNLPKKHHQEFLEKVHKTPHDESLMEFLNQKTDRNIEELIRQEIGNLSYELLKDIKSS